jgi:hypothetical protein
VSWTRFEGQGQILDGFLKVNIGALVIEACQIMCQECLVPSPYRVLVFNEKNIVQKNETVLALPIFMKTETKPQ